MFENILGNDNVKQELIKTIKLNKLSHSYLFIGTDGIGKKMIAKEFAKMILCIENEKYCNRCKSCIEFDTDNNPDFISIEPDGANIKIEQIRQMQKKILEAPIISQKKVYIIDNADLMTREAQNCILKTLEEPPEYVTIILIGSKEDNFLSTIKSRCSIIKFQNIPNVQIKQYMKKTYDIDVSENILQLCLGSIGKAEKYKDKQELYDNIFQIINNVEKMDMIDFLKKANLIYQSQDEKNDILDSINIILFNKSKQNIKYLNCIDYVEETKKRLSLYTNYNMCIDNMLFRIGEEMN